MTYKEASDKIKEIISDMEDLNMNGGKDWSQTLEALMMAKGAFDYFAEIDAKHEARKRIV